MNIHCNTPKKHNQTLKNSKRLADLRLAVVIDPIKAFHQHFMYLLNKKHDSYIIGRTLNIHETSTIFKNLKSILKLREILN